MPEYSGSAHRLSLYVEQYDSRLTTGKANWLAAVRWVQVIVSSLLSQKVLTAQKNGSVTVLDEVHPEEVLQTHRS